MSRFWFNRLFPFVMLAEALAALVTLGFWYPTWCGEVAVRYARYRVRRGLDG